MIIFSNNVVSESGRSDIDAQNMMGHDAALKLDDPGVYLVIIDTLALRPEFHFYPPYPRGIASTSLVCRFAWERVTIPMFLDTTAAILCMGAQVLQLLAWLMDLPTGLAMFLIVVLWLRLTTRMVWDIARFRQDPSTMGDPNHPMTQTHGNKWVA